MIWSNDDFYKVLWESYFRLFLFTLPYCSGNHVWAAGTGNILSLHYLLRKKQDALVRFMVSLLCHRVLSQWQPTRSPRPAFTLTAELFIKGEKRTGDLANFSMGLLAVLALSRPMKRQAQRISLEWSASVLLNIFLLKQTSTSVHTIKRALSDSLTCARVDRSCVSWADTVLAAFKDTERQCVGVWIRPLQIYWVHSHRRTHPAAAARVVLKVGDFASCRHRRECLCVVSFGKWHRASEACRG